MYSIKTMHIKRNKILNKKNTACIPFDSTYHFMQFMPPIYTHWSFYIPSIQNADDIIETGTMSSPTTRRY